MMYSQSELKKIADTTIINLAFNEEAPKLIDPVRYILSMGGKRIRPVISLMALNLFSDHIDDGIMPAAGIEIFHNFTLVHDDIMDQAPVRRNLPTVHTKWNVNQAILSGDVMAFIANECFLQAPQKSLAKVFRIFNKAAIEVCVGQQLDMEFEKSSFVTEAEYVRMIELKTAALLAASVRIGAVIGGADDRDADLLYDFGRNLGLAFQIQDDLLDVYGDKAVFGKKPGGDIVAGKKTILLVKALEAATQAQQKRLHELFSEDQSDPSEKVNEVIGIYNQTGVKEKAEKDAEKLIEMAFGSLAKINVRKERREEIEGLAASLIGREK